MRQIEHLPALTSIRFFAAALIVILHLKVSPLIGRPPLALGIGVSLFYILSGFILAHNYLDRSGKGWIKKFFIGRVAKLMPLHVVTLILAVVLLKLPPFDISKFLVNFFLLQSWIPDISWVFSYNAVAWSISTEAFFYLFFPLLVIFRKHATLILFLWILAFAGFLFFESNVAELPGKMSWKNVIKFNPIVRSGEFIAGFWIYTNVYLKLKDKGLSSAVVSIIQILSLVFFLVALVYSSPIKLWLLKSKIVDLDHMLFMYFVTTLFVFPSLILILALAFKNGILSRVLSWRPLVILGEISFATYMIHQIVLKFFRQKNMWEADNQVAILFLFLVLSYGASYLLFKFVEIPGQNAIKKVLKPKKT